MSDSAIRKRTSGPLLYMIDCTVGWVRLFGVGVLWKHASEAPVFSERYGYVRFWRIPGTPWRVRWLSRVR